MIAEWDCNCAAVGMILADDGFCSPRGNAVASCVLDVVADAVCVHLAIAMDVIDSDASFSLCNTADTRGLLFSIRRNMASSCRFERFTQFLILRSRTGRVLDNDDCGCPSSYVP